MRRKDREITDFLEIIKIIDRCEVCTLGFFDEEYPYLLPLNFGYNYDLKNKNITLYFHGANEGKKLSLIPKSNKVGFQMDCNRKLIIETDHCNCTMEFESICGNGKIEILDKNSKADGLNHIMNHYLDKNNIKDKLNYNEKVLKSTTVFKLKVNEISGKKI